MVLIFWGSLFSENIYLIIHEPSAKFLENLQRERIDYYHNIAENYIELYQDEKVLSELNYDTLRYEILYTESDFTRNLEGYRTYPDFYAEISAIASDPDYENITSMQSLGKSQGYLYYEEGNNNYEDFQQEVWCLKISDNPELNEDEPNVFFGAAIHGREPISLEVDMHILYYLLENYQVEDSVACWIDNTQIWFIPLINPDGHKLSVEELHTMQRKNIRDNDLDGNVDYSSVDGVDLNRNFDFHWNGPYSSSNYTSQSYRGPSPWSEPETVYLRDLLQSYKFYAGITYHSYGQWVLWPLGHDPNAGSYDELVMDDLATRMAATIPKIDDPEITYGSKQASIGYLGSGTMGDWGYGVERIFSFTIELATTFYPPASQIEQICQDNLQAPLIMLDRINYAMVTGNITDISGDPLIAEVYVVEIDSVLGMSEVAPVRSDSTFGRFYRLLMPGEYTFRFCHPEYEDRVYYDVPVLEDEVTALDVIFGSEFVQEINIEISGDNVVLSWQEQGGYGYEVLSSPDAYGSFTTDNSGIFSGSGSWESPLTEAKLFYKIKKIPLP